MTLSYWQRMDREAERNCDVAVVGGGLIGCATAYWLRRIRPRLRVTLLERTTLASGASGRSAGFLRPGVATDYATDREHYGTERARRLWHFTRENAEMMAADLQTHAFALEASGSMTVAGSREEDDRLRASVSPMRRDGYPAAYIPPHETNLRILGQGFEGGLYVPSGAMLNPGALVRYLAGESGADVLEYHEVISLQGGRGHLLLETTRRNVVAGQVVLALNAYTPGLFPELAACVRPVRAQMLALAPLQPRWLHLPVNIRGGDYYLRQLPDGTLLVGGARRAHQAEEESEADVTTPALQADLLAFLHTHFPQTRGLDVRCRWSGTMGFSPDRLPAVGMVPGLDGGLWAGGFSGRGLGFGFRFGRLLAECTLGYARPEGLDLFAVARFAPTLF